VDVESATGEVSVNAPPVELDIVMTTVPALAVNKSATDPETTVRLTDGDVSATFVVLNVTGAA
jgi:hypothetical protein